MSRYTSDANILVKLIPRIDPASLLPRDERPTKKGFIMQRSGQLPFSYALVAEHNPELARTILKQKFRDDRTFEVFRKNRYRKGLLYKAFNIK